VSLTTRDSGHDWVDKASPEPFGGYRYDLYSAVDIAEFIRSYGRFFQDWFVQDFGKQGYPEDSQHTTAYARDFRLEKIRGDGSSWLRLTGGKLRAEGVRGVSLPQQTISIEMTLGSDIVPFIDLEYRVEGKEATPLAESSVVPLSLKLRRPSFHLGQSGSVIDPARDIVSGANHGLWCADWVYAGNDSMGMSILLRDMPLVSIGNTGIYRFETDQTSIEPPVYAHLSNTQWGTNFPQWLKGDFRWRVRLALSGHRFGWSFTEILNQRMSASSPTFHHEWDRFFRVQRSQLLSARPRHDGRGLAVRLRNDGGYHTMAWLQPRDPISAIWRCDLMERPIEKLFLERDADFAGGGLDVPLRLAPYAIETLLIEFDTNP
jgi:hypothetical protein